MISLRMFLTLSTECIINIGERRKKEMEGRRVEGRREGENGEEEEGRKGKVKEEGKGEKKEKKKGASKQMNPVLWQPSCPPSFLEDPQQ